MADEKKFMCEFIDTYRSLPSLWKVKSKDYSNRVLKNSDYAILVEKLKEKDPVANRETVIKEINKLRTNYRRELKKVKSSEKSGAGAEDIYVPTLWYFPLLSFLKEQEESVKSINTMDESITNENSEPLPKKKKFSAEDNLIKLATQTLEKSSGNRDDSVTQSWAFQYNKLEDRQQIIANKMVSDILFQASLGSLQLNHSVQMQNIFNPPPKTIKISSMPLSQHNSTYTTPRSQFVFNRITDHNPVNSNRPIILSRTSTPISPYSQYDEPHSDHNPSSSSNRPIVISRTATPISPYSQYEQNESITYETAQSQSSDTTEIQNYYSNFSGDMNF